MPLADPPALDGPSWMNERRTASRQALAEARWPTSRDEVWRYSRIDEFDRDRFTPARRSGVVDAGVGRSLSEQVHALAGEFGPRSALLVTLDGVLTTVSSTLAGDVAYIGKLADSSDGEVLIASTVGGAKDFVLMNDVECIDPLLIDVGEGCNIADPVVVIHVVTGEEGSATFPRTVVRVKAGGHLALVEAVVDVHSPLLRPTSTNVLATPPGERMVAPVTELVLDENATLDYVGIQSLSGATWQFAHQSSRIDAGAVMRSFVVALGGNYARLRTDSLLMGQGGRSELRAAFIGRDDQMLDFRTLQDHAAPKTVSDLLFMGAVTDRAHSVYSGLIRVRNGAVKSDARQTNHNLVLNEGAHADSVPNLDILENDVACSHGSTVGPVDEDQLYYLASRGIEPGEAERLIVGGFFASIAEQTPVAGTQALIARALAARTELAHD